jgi:hypothetical protein
MSALLLASAIKHFRDPGFYRQMVPGYLCLADSRGGTQPDCRPPLAVMTKD